MGPVKVRIPNGQDEAMYRILGCQQLDGKYFVTPSQQHSFELLAKHGFKPYGIIDKQVWKTTGEIDKGQPMTVDVALMRIAQDYYAVETFLAAVDSQ
jgi:hypothetical protein